MSAWIVAGADAIQKDVEARLAVTGQTYKKLSLDEKLGVFINLAVGRMVQGIGLDLPTLFDQVTDFVSMGASIYEHHHTMDVSKKASMLGLTGVELSSVDLGGASLPAALGLAQKICEDPDRLVLIAGAEVPRGGPTGIAYYREISDALLHPVTELHTHTNLISLYALLADRLMFETGIATTHVEAITRHYRNAAIRDERAASFGKPFKEGELQRYLAGCYATPMVAVVTDHGVAFLVAGSRMLEKLRAIAGFRERATLSIVAVGTNSANKHLAARGSFESPGKLAAERAFAQTALRREDIDYAWIYDCFTLMLVRQAADYFGIEALEAANGLGQGFIQVSGKKIRVNQKGGILNTQAAISLSAAAGLLDILDQAEQNAAAEKFLFGGNGGLDTTNSVALLSRHEVKRERVTINQRATRSIPPQALQNGEELILYAAVPVRFNPGTPVPFALGAFRRADGSLVLAHILTNEGNVPGELDVFVRDQALFRLHTDESGVTARPI